MTDSIFARRIPSANVEPPAAESVLDRLAWIGELEASLEGSRKALLALDLRGIERGTCEQLRLLRKLDGMRRPPRAREDVAPGLVRAPELERELQRAGNRVRGAVLLQAALLARAQSKLHVLANMLAGPSVDYGRLVLPNSGGLHSLGLRHDIAIDTEVRRRSDSCRA